ncbi:MAG: hypothetical protein R3B84_03150 [Zavarzinella sp.]
MSNPQNASSNVEVRLQELSTALVEELISLTPPSMSVIVFEIVSTEDVGADIGLLENHPDVVHVALSDVVYSVGSRYIPYVKQYVPGWHRTLFTIRKNGDQWEVAVDFQRA